MRGKVLSAVNDPSVWAYGSSYVQINIYDTSVGELRERGVNIQNILQDIGCHSVIMDVPILKSKSYERKTAVEDSIGAAEDARPSENFPCFDQKQFRDVSRLYDTVVKEEEPVSKSCEISKKVGVNLSCSSALAGPSSDNCGENLGGEAIFQDCICEFEENGKFHETNPEKLFPETSQILKEYPITPLSTTTNSGDAYERKHPNNTDGTKEGCSFLEFSKEVMDGMRITNLSRTCSSNGEGIVGRAEPVRITQENLAVGEAEEENDALEIADTSYVLAELSNTAQAFQEKMSDSAKKLTRKKVLSHKSSRKRARRSSSQSQQSPPEEERSENAVEATGQKCTLLSRKQEPTGKIFECKYPGCTSKVSWRPRYGKNRLVDHVRVHWGKEVKKCSLCTYVASHQKKVLNHHRRYHKGVKFTGVVSLETNEDMEELVNLWKQCFPGATLKEFRDPQWAGTQCGRLG
ncbi:hypothetical protein RB195_004906 [Necator americanus]|uniref:C2H2-type domain-containing protein n=1 Tax=Necator americanus TaxID=51031 RepID=A0ABR1BKA5_NECAM